MSEQYSSYFLKGLTDHELANEYRDAQERYGKRHKYRKRVMNEGLRRGFLPEQLLEIR